MKDYKELSKEEKRKISDHIKKSHKSHIEKRPDFEEGVSSFMDSLHKELMKDNIIAEKFTMNQRNFNDEIAKSLSKIYSEQLEDKMNSLANPELTSDSQPNSNSLTDEIAVIEDFFKEKATPEQIKILVQKHKKKKLNRNYNARPENREKRRQKALEYNATARGKEVTKQATLRYRSTPKGQEAHKRSNDARKFSTKKKNSKMLLKM